MWNYIDILMVTNVCLCFTACNVGDEGGFAPNIQNNEEGVSLSCKFYVDFGNVIVYYLVMLLVIWLQCFDTVGWVSGRASGL